MEMMFCEVDWWIDSWDYFWMIMIIITPSPLLMIIKFPPTSVSISLLSSERVALAPLLLSPVTKTSAQIPQDLRFHMGSQLSQLWIDRIATKKPPNPPGSQSPVPSMVSTPYHFLQSHPSRIAEVLDRIKSPVSMVKSPMAMATSKMLP